MLFLVEVQSFGQPEAQELGNIIIADFTTNPHPRPNARHPAVPPSGSELASQISGRPSSRSFPPKCLSSQPPAH